MGPRSKGRHGSTLAGNRGGEGRWTATRPARSPERDRSGARECGFHVALRVLDEMPECPHCGNAQFARASMFDVAEPDTSDLHDDDVAWLDAVRDGLGSRATTSFRDDDRVTVMPLVQEWTRIGRSLAADIRLDDPTVSRRHALVVRQDERCACSTTAASTASS